MRDVIINIVCIKMYALYLLVSSNKRTYTGITTDIVRRIRQHNGEIKGGAKATRACRPWRLVCEVRCIPTQSQAQSMEYQVRKLATRMRSACRERGNMIQLRIQSMIEIADAHKLSCFFTSPPATWV